MVRLLLPVAALLLSDALLLIGHGIQVTLLPLRAEIEGFTPAEIALTGSSYFVGFVVGCLVAPRIIRRVGHIRSFAVLASMFSALVLLFHGVPEFYPWLVLRFVVGCCISGLYMIIESWLNESSTRETRGTVLSSYTMINLTMIVVGQQLLNYADPSSATLFGLAAIMLSLAIIPVSLTLSLAPAPIEPMRINISRVWEISHVAVAGAVASGLVTGAFWSLGPVYARGVGLDTSQLTVFMSAVVLGGALFQMPLGKLSDKLDRRVVIMFTALFGAIISVLMAILSGSFQSLIILAALWGGMVMTQYAICMAHAADNAESHEFVMVGSCILLLFGISSAVGGPLASVFMEFIGAVGMFIYSALCLVGFALVVAVRRHRHVKPILDETEPFRAMADTSPAAFAMDPRTEEDAWESRSPSAELDLQVEEELAGEHPKE